MFYTLHRAFKFLTFCALLGVGWAGWQRRQVLEPLLIWYQVWENGGFNVEPLPKAHGTVLKVMNSQTFVMESEKKLRLNVRMTGLRDPVSEPSVASLERETARRAAVEEMIEGKFVTVHFNYADANNIGGLVFLKTTNINAWMALRRHALTHPDLIKPFPKDDQYQMLWARRHRDPPK